MDITTIVGIVLGIVIMVFGISFDMNTMAFDFSMITNFIDIPSIIIVFGGTFAAIVASYPVSTLKQIPKHMKIMMNGNKYNPMAYIDLLVEFSQVARKSGILALEEMAQKQTDPFFKQSIMLIVDATDPDKVKTLLNTELDYLAERHEDAVSLYEKASAVAPAFGMIGTLIGLVNMLRNMNLDDSSGSATLGASMAVALITTFYGCILSHLVFSPIAKKLSTRNDEEYLCKQIIIEGVLSIQSGENPKFMREKLVSYLSERERDEEEKSGRRNEDTGGRRRRKK